MKTLNYEKLMARKPDKFDGCDIVNQFGQTVEFYEHPNFGDEYPVIAVFNDRKIAVATDFYECDDFYADSEYNPILTNNGEVLSYFEIEEIN